MFSIERDKESNSEVIVLLDIGTHDEVLARWGEERTPIWISKTSVRSDLCCVGVRKPAPTWTEFNLIPARPACNESEHKSTMNIRMNMIYWKSDKFRLGRLIEHPDIMTQGETIKELEENLKDAFMMMALDDVPDSFQMKEIAV